MNNLRELRVVTKYAIEQSGENYPLTLGGFKKLLDLAIKIREDIEDKREEDIHNKALQESFDY